MQKRVGPLKLLFVAPPFFIVLVFVGSSLFLFFFVSLFFSSGRHLGVENDQRLVLAKQPPKLPQPDHPRPTRVKLSSSYKEPPHLYQSILSHTKDMVVSNQSKSLRGLRSPSLCNTSVIKTWHSMHPPLAMVKLNRRVWPLLVRGGKSPIAQSLKV